MMKNRFQKYYDKFLADNTMRNPLLALIACCTLIAPFQAAACACADTYVDGGYIELPNPPYPEHARLKNEQGIVKLRVRVAPNNRIRLVEAAESSGSPLLDEAVVAAVHQYRFQAALLCEQRQPENVSSLFPLRRDF